MKKGVAIEVLFAIVLSMSFVFAAHVITTSTGATSYNFNEDVGNIYNITVNNTGLVLAANVTEVNITIPSSFSFLADSNGTNAGTNTFVNTSVVLSWNGDNLVPNISTQEFWFNATAVTPGNYNLTVTTSNFTGAYSSNISVTINDTTLPVVYEGNISSPVTDSNHSETLLLNVTVTDNVGVQAVYFNLTNSSGVQVGVYDASNPGGNSWNASVDTSGFDDGNYNITIYANDSAGNLNNSGLVYDVFFDNTNPGVTYTCTPTSVVLDRAVTCTCTGTDSGSGVITTIYETTPKTTSPGSFSETCSVTDHAGNSASTDATYTVTGLPGGSVPVDEPEVLDLEDEGEVEEDSRDEKVDAEDRDSGEGVSGTEGESSSLMWIWVVVIVVLIGVVAWILRGRYKKNSYAYMIS